MGYSKGKGEKRLWLNKAWVKPLRGVVLIFLLGCGIGLLGLLWVWKKVACPVVKVVHDVLWTAFVEDWRKG